MIWLFSYGTLQQPDVQLAVFGRTLASEIDSLVGFTLDWITIVDPAVVATSGSERHRILRHDAESTAVITGAALAIEQDDLAAVDDYEGSNYTRITVTLASGRRAFVYVEPG